MSAVPKANAGQGDAGRTEQPAALGLLFASAREHWLWLVLGGLLSGMWAMFAYSHLLSLHFRAWELLSTRPSSDALAQALRDPIMGWFEPAVLILGVVAGAVGALAAVQGRWRPLAIYFGAMTAVMVAMEVTQSLGQDESRPGAVEEVPVAGVILIALIVVVELLLLVSARPRVEHRS